MKHWRTFITLIAMGVLGTMSIQAQDAAKPKAAKPVEATLGWKLGPQAWSFNKFTFFEAVDNAQKLGLHYIEGFPGQKISKDHGEAALLPTGLSKELEAEVLAKLKKANVKLVNYGVVGLGEKEAENRQVFEFAKRMGIKTIVSEPAAKDLPAIDKLCEEYKINVAIHNHPKPSPYWDPQILLKAVEGRSKRIGSCADTGHWMRSGVEPLEALKLLQGRIISLHFKDLNEKGMSGHDVPWGTGVCNVPAMLAELHRQGFKGVFSIEYEYNMEASMPEMEQCVKNFRKLCAAEIKNTAAKKPKVKKTAK